MAAYRAPGEMTFEGNMAEEWKTWKQKFSHFMVAMGKSGNEDNGNVARMINLMGDKGLQLYNTFDFNTPEDRNKIDIVTQKFDTYCEPKKNLIYEHFKFFSRDQKEEETIDQFVTGLKQLASTCEFLERDVMIRDRIVLGIKNKQLQEKLLGEPELKLEEAMHKCRIYEATKTQMGDIHKEEAKVDVISRPSSKSNEEKRSNTRYQFLGQNARDNESEQSQVRKACYNCGLDHPINKCIARNKKCNSCGKIGHFARKCRRKKVQQVDDESLSEDEVFVINAIGKKHTTQWLETIQVNNNSTTFKIDTGSQVNILAKSTYDNIKKKAPIEGTGKRLHSYTGHHIEVLGTTKLQCRWSEQEVNLKFYIVKTGKDNQILGLKACEKLKIMERCKPQSPKESRIQMVSKEEHPQDIIKEYNEVFTGLGKLPGKYKIKLTEKNNPKIAAARKIPLSIEKQVKKEIDNMEKEGILKKIKEPTDWSHPIVVINKPNKKLRICMDPRELNKYVRRERYTMPTQETAFAELNGATVFTVLDASTAFHQIVLEEESSKLCTITTPYGRYRYTRLPYGISSAPEVFQRLMNEAMEGIPGIIVYMDDILIYGKNLQDHNEKLRRVLERAKQTGLKLSKNKTQLAVKEVSYLGHIVSGNGIRIDTQKIEAIQNLSTPKNRKELQRFLGMATYLAKFIDGLSTITAPLRELLSIKNAWTWEKGGPEQKAFEKLKMLLTKAPVLRFFDDTKETTLSVDASHYGIGAVLLQEQRPVAYSSYSLTETQKRYNQIEKELLAIVKGCEHYNYFLYGREFTVETDHRPLLAIVKKPIEDLSPRLQRLVLRLMRYQATLKYVPGKTLLVADTLSRDPTKKTFPTNYLDGVKTVLGIKIRSHKSLEKLVEATNEDQVLKLVKEYCQKGWPKHKQDLTGEVKKYWDQRGNIREEDGVLITEGTRVIIPKILKKEYLKIIHVAHQGIVTCKNRAREVLYWPGMMSDIEEYVQSCRICNSYSAGNIKEKLIPHQIPRLPWEKIGVDFKSIRGMQLLVMVDYHSKFAVVDHLKNQTAKTVIKALKRIFKVLGLPQTIYSDNGPPFGSAEYREFTKQLGITVETSSPRYPASNGMVERTIETIKGLITKALDSKQDMDMAIMHYNASPKQDLPSPAEMMMGRRLRTTLPTHDRLLEPKYEAEKTREKLRNRRKRQMENDANRGRRLKQLEKGQNVYIQTGMREWAPARIVAKEPHRSYRVELNNGMEVRRNRIHLRPDQGTRHKEERSQEEDKSEEQDTGVIQKDRLKQPEKSEHGRQTRTEDTQDINEEADEVEKPGTVRTRSGRVVKAPDRLNI